MPASFVAASGTGFQLNGAPFAVTGVNCYFLAYCNDENRRAAMATAKAMGATVIRAWAFLAIDDFAPGRVAFQYFKDGSIVLNDGPDGLQRLDALIKAAEDLDLKLILPLINHWEALGGMPTYVKWLSPGAGVTEFYRSPALRLAYQTWVSHILTRRNTVTGRLYSEEPSIMGLGTHQRSPLRNPRRGANCCSTWVREMSAYVKSLDRNHLLALGDEGFFSHPESALQRVEDFVFHKRAPYLYNGTRGVDWEANLAVPDIDFGTYHFYPQDWDHSDDLDFATRWISDHYTAAAALNKPVIMEEFGLKLDPKTCPPSRFESSGSANGRLPYRRQVQPEAYCGCSDTKGLTPAAMSMITLFSTPSKNCIDFPPKPFLC